MVFNKIFLSIVLVFLSTSVCLARPVIHRNLRSGKIGRTPKSRLELCAPNFNSECNAQNIELDYATVEQRLSDALANNSTLLPAFVRIAFHDCITATPDKPDSGCNGSIRLPTEQAQPANSNLLFALAAIIQATACTCVSVADGIQLANAVALIVAGGPNVRSFVVDSSNPRTDVLFADTVAGELPSPGSNYAQLKEFYERKGLDETDLVSSSTGGHSLGRFTQGLPPRVPFTNDTNTVSGHYAYNLFQKRTSGSNLNGFNTLRSDDALNENAGARGKLDSYCGCQSSGSSCSPDYVSGGAALNAEFGKFIKKQSRLTGLTVGKPTVLSQGL